MTAPKMQYKISYSGKTDVGLRRSKNEDTYGIVPEKGYYLVADGMGGAAAGDLASGLFSEATSEIFRNTDYRSEDAIIQKIQNAFRLANETIINHVQHHPDHKGMGCTAELIAFNDDVFVLGHIGDSRTYRLRNGTLKQLTQDHSFVQEQVNQGLLTAEEARTHPSRNVVLRAVGISEQLSLDIIRGKTHPADQYLLCSDGLSDMIDNNQIQTTLNSDMIIGEKVERLIEMALSAGGLDNVTVVLLEIIPNS
jgi:protein phosphatase